MRESQREDVFYRDLDTDRSEPSVEVVEANGRIDERDPTDLNPLWACVDGMLDDLLSDPPDEGADMEVEFTYESFRITVPQDGTSEFVRT